MRSSGQPAGSVRATKDMAVTRKRLSTMSIWLGLFAMLMIHAGPLFSAIQAAQAGVQHHHHAEHQPSAHDLGQRHHAQGHHGQPRTGEPAWLTALELCGYCELLTVNPPLSLAPAVGAAAPRSRPSPAPSRTTAAASAATRSGHPRFCTADVIDRPWRFNHLKWKFYVQHYSWLYGACACPAFFDSTVAAAVAHAALLGNARQRLAAEHDHAAHGEPGDSANWRPWSSPELPSNRH